MSDPTPQDATSSSPPSPTSMPADHSHERAAHELADHARGGWINGIVRAFLHSNLSLILLVISVAVGAAALLITPREEDPQIVVPLADIYVNAPGMSSQQVERLVTTPLERILYQIDGVEYVYSMSRADTAIVTVRFYVGQDRERSLVRLFKKLEESKELIPPGVANWVMKPVEIDDVPIVTLTLRARAGANPSTADEHTLRRVSEELAARIAVVEDTSRVTITGGLPRVLTAYLDREAIAGRGLALLDVQNAVQASNVLVPAGDVQRSDTNIPVRAGFVVRDATDLANLVVGVSGDRPVFLRDVARIEDGPAERVTFVRHGWGPGRGFEAHHHAAGTLVGTDPHAPHSPDAGQHAPASADAGTVPAVTIAVAKKKGTNAVNVAEDILREAERLKAQVIPDEFELVVTRNSGLIADEKVSELVEGLWVAILIVVALLTIGLGWRESIVVAVAVPVVFGLTLAVNLIAGYTINRVTLFALILSLGLLVDDPIVDVENIARHFSLRKRASRAITLEAVSEIRPPLISATLAVIASFLPLFFITGMMGPYMRPMALNVPVTMVMSMLVAFTITPWLAFHLLKKRNWAAGGGHGHTEHADEFATARASIQYRILRPLLQPLLKSRLLAWSFLAMVAILTGAAAMLAGFRQVPLKMLPFDNKAEILLLVNADEGTPLERTDAAVRDLETALAAIPEVTDYTSYVGVNSPIDFNGLVRHYYLRTTPNQAEIRVNLVGKKSRLDASHTLGLRERDALTAIATKAGIRLKIVELPPGPPVIDTIAAEIYGDDDLSYAALCNAAELVRDRLALEPGVVEPDDTVEAPHAELLFIPDQEKAALSGVSVADIAATVRAAISGVDIGVVHAPNDRQPLTILARLPIADRSSPADLSLIQVRGTSAPGTAPTLVTLGEIGTWEERPAEQMIYHKNLQRVAYVFAETAGRPPADVIVDVMHDRTDDQNGESSASNTAKHSAGGWLDPSSPRPIEGRSHLFRGGGIPWNTAPGTRVVWSGEGEWKITLDVFRDLGLAFAAALVMIYVILVAQTRSFMIPVVVMLAIPLTMVGIMPGFWLLGVITGKTVGGYADPVFFTATAMIGMIALSGIVTRQSIILVDFIHLCIERGRPFMDAVIEAGAVRLRPILLVVAAAMLSAIPITIDPIFSGLAWALIFGLIASTIFTLFVIPLVYWMLYKNIPGHGVDMTQDD